MQLQKMLGTDRFGVVSFLHHQNEKKFFKVQCKETQRLYTMEALPNNNPGRDLNGSTSKDMTAIKSIGSAVNFPFCMQLKFFFKTSQKCYYILDYTGETSLASLTSECDGFPESTVLSVASELAIALNSLHDRELSYGELSLDTVMVDNDGHVVLWREFDQKQYWDVSECVCSLQDVSCNNPNHRTRRGSRTHSFRELSSEVKLESIKDDWQALGAVLHSLLVGQMPEKETNHEETYFPEFVTANTKDFIDGLLKGTVETFDEVKRHHCFTNLDWAKVNSKSLPSPLKTTVSPNADSTMSRYHSKYSSSHNISSASPIDRQGYLPYSARPKFPRSSSSSELFSSSLSANLKHGLPDHHLSTSSFSLSFPIETNINQKSTRMGQLGITRDNEDYSTPSSMSQIDFYSSHGLKSMPAESGYRVNSSRACSSAPSSPRHTASLYPSSTSASLYSSSTSALLYSSSSTSAVLKKSDVHLKSDAVAGRSSTHETLSKSRSSTDIASLVSSPVPQATRNNPFPKTTLNRSRSYTDIKKASCVASNETEQSARPGANNPKSDSDQSTKGEQRRKRHSTWTRIPTFEEFRAMNLSGKTACESRRRNDMNNNDMSTTCKSSDNTDIIDNNNNNDGHVTDSVTIPESSQSQTVETKEASIPKNPVIQELLVKYGLNKTTNLTRRPVKNTSVCCSMSAAPVPRDITSSKHRLLSMVDDFLANKDKEKGLRPSRSTSDVRSCNSLGERRTLSSPRMTVFEKYHMSEARKCLNNDVGRDLESSETLVVRSRINSGKNEEGTAQESSACIAEISDYSSGNDASVACQDGLGNLHRPRNSADDTGDSILKCQTEKKDNTKTNENSGLEKGDEQLTEESISVVRQGEENALTQQQPEISITVSSSENSPTLSSTAPLEFTKMSRKAGEKDRKVLQRKRSSSERIKKCGRKDRKRRGRTFSDESQRENKDDSSGADAEKINHSLVIQRTSSLLSLSESVMSYDEPRDLEVLEEFPGNEMGSRRGSRNSTRSDGSLNAEPESDFLRKGRPRSSKSGSDFSITGSNSSLISRGSSFVSNISTDSGSLHVDFEDSDADEDVFNDELRVVHEKAEFEIKRNDSGLGDEIGVTPRLRKRWEDIVDGSSQRWSVVATSARYWREVTVKKKESKLQEQKCNEERKLSRERRISSERSPNAINCPDCGRPFLVNKDEPSVFSEGPQHSVICCKCQSNRVERKEAIIELVQTEINCGNDFQILKEEFFSPMQSGGIVSPENLAKIFLNIQELLDVSLKFCKKIETSMQECIGKDDEEFCHMQVGKIFVDNVEFFQAYELYCSKQPDAFRLLESLQKKNEVLRVFLNITCRENSKCRKMDINSFLLAPVQRLMKYPLLLNRIRKATPRWHGDREDLKLAQRKVEDQITKINSLTKSSDVKTKKFQSNLGNSDAVDASRLKKLACDVLSWTMDEIQLLMHGVLKVTFCEFGMLQSWTKRAVKRSIDTHLLFCIRGQNEPIEVDSEDDDNVKFPHISDVTDASLLLLKRKNNGKYTLFRDEIRLRDCVVYEETEMDSFGLIHMRQETFVFTTRTSKEARRWIKHLKLQTKDQGKWRLRRNALSNIMLKAS